MTLSIEMAIGAIACWIVRFLERRRTSPLRRHQLGDLVSVLMMGSAVSLFLSGVESSVPEPVRHVVYAVLFLNGSFSRLRLLNVVKAKDDSQRTARRAAAR
jgi:hypothetical protein